MGLERGRGDEVNGCDKCDGMMWVPSVDDQGRTYAKPCDCLEEGRVNRYLRAAKIPDSFAHVELDNYETDFLGCTARQKQAVFMVRKFAQKTVAETGSAGIILTGNCGSGKTHLAVGLLKHLMREQRRTGIFYASSRLLEVIKSTYDRDDLNEWDVMEPVVTRNILVLDDLGSGRLTEYVQEKIAYILGERYDRKLTTIITTNYVFAEPTQTPEAIASGQQKKLTLGDCVGDRAFSRLQEMCLVVPVEGPDFRATIRKASTLNML